MPDTATEDVSEVVELRTICGVDEPLRRDADLQIVDGVGQLRTRRDEPLATELFLEGTTFHFVRVREDRLGGTSELEAAIPAASAIMAPRSR